MNNGAGGIGMIGVDISHPVVLVLFTLLAVLVVFGGWKLLKLLLAASGG
jgi:hypothetical protein